MGTFQVHVEVGNREGSRWEPLEALVDTGATFSVIPESTWQALGLQAGYRLAFELADSRTVERDVAEARIRIDGQERPTLLVSAGADAQPLLGAYTLEAFLVAPDPIHKRLIPVPGLLLGIGERTST